MIFLNPLFLVGLGAAAIPIIIHLLNLRKIRTIEFSTLSFLKELQRTQIRRIKLRQLLLLILRTLLIIFIVLAFSRPAIQTGGGVIGADAHTTAAILFDNSASMNVYNEHGNVFRQASERVLAVIDLLREGDNVILLRQSDLPDATTTSATADRERVRQIVRETVAQPVHREFNQGIINGHSLLQESPHLNREIYIITDMQASHWRNGETEIHRVFDDSYRAYIIPVEVEQFDNAAIHDISFRSSLFESGKPITIDAEIRNYGSVDLDNHLVSVFLNGTRVGQKAIDLPAGGTTVVEFTVTPDRTGILKGYLELEDDALEIDNRYYFTIAIPEQLNVLLVGQSRNDVQFVETALAARSDGSDASAVQTHFVSAGNLATEDISEYQCIIAVNVPSFSDAQTDRITRYVEQGGGFILFPGDDIDVQNYNRGLLSNLQLPEIRNIAERSGSESATMLFDQIDYDHPIFQDIFEEQIRQRAAEETRIESPRIYKSIETGPTRTADTQVITLSGGQPFLISGQRENGTVLLFSVHPGMQWSDFPVRGVFVPLIHRSLLYSSAVDHDNDRFLAGEDVSVSVPAVQAAIQANYILVHPDGTEERIQPQHLAAAGVLQFTFESVPQTGLYRIRRNGTTVRAFAVNIHPGESTGERIGNESLKERLEEFGLENAYIIGHDEDLASVVEESRYGRELWKLFAFLAFIMAFIETVIARDPKEAASKREKLS